MRRIAENSDREGLKMIDEQMIWEMLMNEIGNPYGVAGLMGNLMAESSLNPLCKTGGNNKMKGSNYVSAVMNGEITPYDFAHDKVAFGLAQWCFWSRKEKLFLFIRENGLNIGSASAQIQYLLKEIKGYRTVWKTLKEATSVGEASDIVLLRYEKPANTSDNVKAKRMFLGMQFYERYAVKDILSIDEMQDLLSSVQKNYALSDKDKEGLIQISQTLEKLKANETG